MSMPMKLSSRDRPPFVFFFPPPLFTWNLTFRGVPVLDHSSFQGTLSGSIPVGGRVNGSHEETVVISRGLRGPTIWGTQNGGRAFLLSWYALGGGFKAGLWIKGCLPTSVIQENPPLYQQHSLWEALSVVSQKWPFPTALF